MWFRKSGKKYYNKKITQSSSRTVNIEKKQIYRVIEILFIVLGGLGILFLVSCALLFFLLYIQRSQYFSIQHIDVKGNKRLSMNRVISLSGITMGDNLLRVRLGSVYERLYESKWIKRVAVRKTLPDTIHIEIEELQASFWVQHNNVLYYADALGFPITPVDKAFFVSLPVLEIENGAEDFIVHLPAIMQELQTMHYPFDVKSISWIKLLSTATVQFFLESSNMTITIAIEDWRENIKKTHYVLQDLAHKGLLNKVRTMYANNVVLVEM